MTDFQKGGISAFCIAPVVAAATAVSLTLGVVVIAACAIAMLMLEIMTTDLLDLPKGDTSCRKKGSSGPG